MTGALPVKEHEASLSNGHFYLLVSEPSFEREFYLVYKLSLTKMASIFSRMMVEMMPIAIKCLNGSETQGGGARVVSTRSCLGHTCDLRSPSLSYLSPSLHSVQLWDSVHVLQFSLHFRQRFFSVKKKSKKVVKSFGQLDSIKVCEAIPTFAHNVYRSTHGLGQKLQETPHSQRWRSLLSKANTGRNCSMGKDLRATYHLSGKGTAAHLIPS